MRRVVVSGMGLVSALGDDLETYWRNLSAGKSAIAPLTRFDVAHFTCKTAAEVATPVAAGEDRSTVWVAAALRQALAAAGLDHEGDLPDAEARRRAVVLGSILGTMESVEREVESDWARWRWSDLAFGAPGAAAAALFRSKGPTLTVSSTCVSGQDAIGLGRSLIRSGRADLVVAIGVDPLVRTAFAGFAALTCLTPDVYRPFDKRGNGFVIGEGAGVLVLEAEEHAIARGRTPSIWVAGYASHGAPVHLSRPDPGGVPLSNALGAAWAETGLPPSALGLIIANGLALKAGDLSETLAIKRFLAAVGREGTVPVTSLGPAIGHTFGACGVLESIAGILAMERGALPPIAHLEEPLADDVDFVVGEARAAQPDAILNMSYGLGGMNGVVVFSRVPPEKTNRQDAKDAKRAVPLGAHGVLAVNSDPVLPTILVTGASTVTPWGRGLGTLLSSAWNEDFGMMMADKRFLEDKAAPSTSAVRTGNRACRLAAMSAGLALEDAGITLDAAKQERVGVIVGVGPTVLGPFTDYFRAYREEGPKGAKASAFIFSAPSTPAATVGLCLGLEGPMFATGGDLLSGAQAISAAVDLLSDGLVEICVVASVSLITRAARRTLRGMRLAAGFEGSYGLVLETEHHFRSRHKRIAEVALTVDYDRTSGVAAGGQSGLDGVDEDLPERAMDGWALLGTQLAFRTLSGDQSFATAAGPKVEVFQIGYFGEKVRIHLEKT